MRQTGGSHCSDHPSGDFYTDTSSVRKKKIQKQGQLDPCSNSSLCILKNKKTPPPPPKIPTDHRERGEIQLVKFEPSEFWNQERGQALGYCVKPRRQAGSRQGSSGDSRCLRAFFLGFGVCWEAEPKHLSSHPFFLHPLALPPHQTQRA